MQKCLVCGEKFEDKSDLFDHYETEHASQFKKGWTGAQDHFFMNHGRITGKCMQCGGTTEWNPRTNLPEKFCSNPKCKQDFRKTFVKRMVNKHGKVHLLDDPEFQKKMLFNRKISGEYKWSDGNMVKYVGSYELDFLRFLDKFMSYKSTDIMVPAPQIVEYKYEGKSHFYIPDVYIPSLNLVIEIKDGGSNPNTHPKIMAVDKVKEKLKDEAIKKLNVNYIKVVDKKYGNFIDFLNNLKDDSKTLNENFLQEEVPDTLSEDFISKLEESVNEYDTYLVVPQEPIPGSTFKYAIYSPGESKFRFNGFGVDQVDSTASYYFSVCTEHLGVTSNPQVRVYKISHCDEPSISKFMISEFVMIKKHSEDAILIELFRQLFDDRNFYYDFSDMIYRSGIFDKVYEGGIKDFINNIDNIQNNTRLTEEMIVKNNMEKILSESELKDNNSLNNLNMGAEPIMVIQEGEEKKELPKLRVTMKTKKYELLIENAYDKKQLEIIESQIVNLEDFDEDTLYALLYRLNLKYKNLDTITKDEMDISILPVRAANIPYNKDDTAKKMNKLYTDFLYTGKLDNGVQYLRGIRNLANEYKDRDDFAIQKAKNSVGII